jgi:exonuclease VII small subunit
MKINNLRDRLIEQIDKIEKGEMPLEQAREISRTSQAILESVRLEIEYSKLINSKLKIDFMEDEINESK